MISTSGEGGWTDRLSHELLRQARVHRLEAGRGCADQGQASDVQPVGAPRTDSGARKLQTGSIGQLSAVAVASDAHPLGVDGSDVVAVVVLSTEVLGCRVDGALEHVHILADEGRGLGTAMARGPG